MGSMLYDFLLASSCDLRLSFLPNRTALRLRRPTFFKAIPLSGMKSLRPTAEGPTLFNAIPPQKDPTVESSDLGTNPSVLRTAVLRSNLCLLRPGNQPRAVRSRERKDGASERGGKSADCQRAEIAKQH